MQMQPQQTQPGAPGQPTHPRRPAAWLPGVLLIAVGAAIAAITWFQVGGEIIVPTIGVIFLVAYAATRNYGFLVPGGILTGLGAGIVVQSALSTEGSPVPILLGLGLGFVAIWVVDEMVAQAANRWWPLVPGVGLVLIGGGYWVGGQRALDTLGPYIVPLVLVALGLWLLLRPRRSVP